MGSEMSKGERMRTHTERTESDHLSTRNSPAKGETENSTHCVLNLEKTRFARFTTRRVVNFSPRLKTLRKTRAPSIRHTLSAEFDPPFHPSLAWTHYRTIMCVEKTVAREFYEQEACDRGEPEILQGVKELKGILK